MLTYISNSAHYKEVVSLDSQIPNFILTNPYEGITKELADRAISILGK